jgi:hypothetical protein
VEISGPQLVTELGMDGEPLVELLPELLQSEPATWHGSQHRNDAGWTYQPSSYLRPFPRRTRRTQLHQPHARLDRPGAAGPGTATGLPAGSHRSAGLPRRGWQLHFGQKLAYLPSFERAARLAFDVTTAAEFDDRLSALREALKGLDLPGPGAGPLDKMRNILARSLPAEALPGVLAALDTLRNVTHVRNAGQHAGTAPAAGIIETVGDLLTASLSTAGGRVDADETRAITQAMLRLLIGVPVRSDGKLTIKSLAQEAGLRRNKLTHKHTGLKDLFYALVKTQDAQPVITADLVKENDQLRNTVAELRHTNNELAATIKRFARVVHVLEVENQQLREHATASTRPTPNNTNVRLLHPPASNGGHLGAGPLDTRNDVPEGHR